jgi:hypothetical protein
MNWQKNLEQGEWFEAHVAKPWLIENRSDWWITDSRNHTRIGGKGPRMTKGKNELVLPDFRLDNAETGESRWFDSKMKKQPFSISGYYGEKFYSIDPRSYKDYQTLMQIFPKMDFDILLGCAWTNKIWLFNLRVTTPVMHQFKNNFVRNSNGLTPCFSTKFMTLVGTWNSNLMPK